MSTQATGLEGKTFQVVLVKTTGNGAHEDVWESDDEEKFSWGVGPAGDLMIFRSRFHKAFAARLETDVRWFVYAPGTWRSVQVLDDVVEEAKEPMTSREFLLSLGEADE